MKHARSNGQVLAVRCSSHSLTNGKVRLNNQEHGIRHAAEYEVFGHDVKVASGQLEMEPAGFEPAASSVQARRSTN